MESDQQRKAFYIVTYHDIYQKIIMEKEPFGAQYQERSAIVQMAAGDMKALRIENGFRVKLRNDFGMVVVRAKSDPGCQPGFGFMPVGQYSNHLTNYDPEKSKLPNFKLIKVEVEPTEEGITPLSDLLSSSIRRAKSDA